jgi:hypothetical protein
MDNRHFLGLTGLVVAGIATLFLLKLIPMLSGFQSGNTGSSSYLEQNAIRGSAVVHQDQPYTLNFEQQKQLILLLNNSQTVARTTAAPTTTHALDISSIIVYLFDTTPIEIKPLFYIDEELVYSAPQLDKDNMLRDTSKGKLRQLLAQTFDP